MTDPLSPEESEKLHEWHRQVLADGSKRFFKRLLDIATDHARLVAENATLRKEREYRFADLEAANTENAKLRERVEKLERVVLPATQLANEAMGSAEMARECIGNTNTHCLIQRATEVRAALAACEEKDAK